MLRDSTMKNENWTKDTLFINRKNLKFKEAYNVKIKYYFKEFK